MYSFFLSINSTILINWKLQSKKTKLLKPEEINELSICSVQFSRSVMSDCLRHHGLQVSLSIANSWRVPKLMSIESVMPFNHLILCRSLFLPPSIFPSISLFQWVIYLTWKYLNLIPSLKHSHTKNPKFREIYLWNSSNIKKEMIPIWEKSLLRNVEGSYQVQPISDEREVRY